MAGNGNRGGSTRGAGGSPAPFTLKRSQTGGADVLRGRSLSNTIKSSTPRRYVTKGTIPNRIANELPPQATRGQRGGRLRASVRDIGRINTLDYSGALYGGRSGGGRRGKPMKPPMSKHARMAKARRRAAGG